MPEIELLVHFKKILIIFFIILLCKESFSQTYPDHRVDSLLTSGINSIINQDYSLAQKTFQDLDKEYHQLPLGKIYLTAVYITKAFDYSESFETDSINKYLLEAKAQSEMLIKENDKNIWNEYFLALSEGFYAYFQALNKNWFSALSNGLSSVSDFEKCLEMNKNFYEAYTAIGTYKYWKSRKTEFINWLPFVPNEEEKGISYIKNSIKHFTYNKYLAMNSLIWIYIEEKKYSDAVSLAKEALNEFPKNRSFKWALARAYQDIDINESIKVLSDLLNSYSKVKNINRCNKIIILHNIAQLYKKSGKFDMALNLCNEILNIKDLTNYEKEKLNKRIERVQKLQEELSQDLSK